jgi:hypothetical protein
MLEGPATSICSHPGNRGGDENGISQSNFPFKHAFFSENDRSKLFAL